jgi:hypothetical protein
MLINFIIFIPRKLFTIELAEAHKRVLSRSRRIKLSESNEIQV